MEAAPDVLDVFRRGLRRELHQIVSEPALLPTTVARACRRDAL